MKEKITKAEFINTWASEWDENTGWKVNENFHKQFSEQLEQLISAEVEKRIKDRMPSEEDAQNAESQYEDEQNEDKLRFDTEYCFRDYMNGWEDCRSRLTNPDNNPK